MESDHAHRLMLVTAMTFSVLTGVDLHAAEDYLFNWCYVPIVANNPGKAGTRWQTEPAISNPQPHATAITCRLSQGGTYREQVLTVPARQTVIWENYLGDAWGAEGLAGLYLEAETSSNLP